MKGSGTTVSSARVPRQPGPFASTGGAPHTPQHESLGLWMEAELGAGWGVPRVCGSLQTEVPSPDAPGWLCRPCDNRGDTRGRLTRLQEGSRPKYEERGGAGRWGVHACTPPGRGAGCEGAGQSEVREEGGRGPEDAAWQDPQTGRTVTWDQSRPTAGRDLQHPLVISDGKAGPWPVPCLVWAPLANGDKVKTRARGSGLVPTELLLSLRQCHRGVPVTPAWALHAGRHLRPLGADRWPGQECHRSP